MPNLVFNGIFFLSKGFISLFIPLIMYDMTKEHSVVFLLSTFKYSHLPGTERYTGQICEHLTNHTDATHVEHLI